MKDRLPPHSIEAEQGILGCILQDPNLTVPSCIQKLKDHRNEFYDMRHQELYAVLVEMSDQMEPIDLITVQQRLKERKILEKVGGLAYLSTLMDATPSAVNLEYYLDIVHSKHVARKAIKLCLEQSNKLMADGDFTAAEIVDNFSHNSMSLSKDLDGSRFQTAKTLVQKSIDYFEECHQNQGKLLGLSTGFYALDRIINGLKPGTMVVIAGRPAMGKTSLAMNIAESVAVDQRQPCGIISLEMPDLELTNRLIACRAEINLNRITSGKFVENDMKRLRSVTSEIAGSGLIVDDQSGVNILEIRSKARQMVQMFGIKLLVIDYLQLISGTGKGSNRQEDVTEISVGIKSLSKELSIPIIIIAQLNREIERDKNRKPRLSDLRESGSIEQDADIVGLLYCPVEADKIEIQNEPPVNLLIAKHRGGPTGDIPFTFCKEITKFRQHDYAQDEPETHTNY